MRDQSGDVHPTLFWQGGSSVAGSAGGWEAAVRAVGVGISPRRGLAEVRIGQDKRHAKGDAGTRGGE